MEYSLKQRALRCLVPAASVMAEERFGADSVVPDSLPDAAVVLCAPGELCLWRVDLSEGGAEVEGELRCDVLYRADTDALESFSVSVPVLFRLRDHAIEPDQQPVLTLHVTELTPQLMNSRKVRVSLRVRAALETYAAEELLLSEAAEDAAVCQRQEGVSFELVSAVTEQVFTAEASAPLRMGAPSGERPLAASSSVTVSEVQLLGSRIIVQGAVQMHVTYLDAAQNAVISEAVQTPFSQLMDVDSEQDLSSAVVRVHLTSASVRLLPEEGMAETELHLVAQAVCRSVYEAQILTDAYSNRTALTMQTQTLTLRSPVVREPLHVRADGDVTCDTQGWSIIGTSVSLRGEAAAEVTLLRVDEAGRCAALRQTLRFEPPEDGAVVSAAPEDVAVTPTAEGLHLRLPLTLEVERSQTQTFAQITAIQGEEVNAAAAAMPSVTLLRVSGSPDLWKLAKAHASTVEAIRAANPTDDGEARPFLVIPKVL